MNKISETGPEQGAENSIPVLASYYFLYYCTLGIIFPFSGYFLKQRGYSGTEIGFFLAIFPLAKFLFADYWVRRFSESAHKRIFISACVFTSSVSLILLYFYNNIAVTALSLFILSFSSAGIIPVIDSMAVAMDSRISYGKLRLFGSMGFIVTSITAGYMMDRFGINSFIFTYVAAGLLSIVPVTLMRYDMPFLSARTDDERKLTPELIFFFAGLTVYLTTFSFLSNFLNIKVSSVGLTQSDAGYMWSIGVVSEIFFFYNQDRVLKIMPLKALITVSMLLGGIRYLVTGSADSFIVLFLFSTFHGFSYGTFHTGVMQYIRQKVPDRLKLRAQTIYSGVGYGLGTIMGSGISGIVYDTMGIRAVFSAAAVFCVIGALLIYIFIGTRHNNGIEQN